MNEDYLAAEDNWLGNVWATLKARWWLVLGVTLLTTVLAIVYLRTTTYLYTAELRVYAAPSTTGQSSLPGGIGGLASLAGIGTGASEPATPFRLYLEGIRAREVAEQLARDREIMHHIFVREWDPATRSWHERRGVLGSIKRALWNLLGLPSETWHAPDADRLQDFIADEVAVVQSAKTPLVSISFDSADPKFAAAFLTRLGNAVDEYLREKQQQRTANNIDYLSDKLRTVTLVEQREALYAALTEQERQAMLANSRAPYAANNFGAAVASSNPTKPRQLPLLFAGVLGGLVLGSTIAVLIGRPRRRDVIVA